MAVGLGIMLFW